MDKKASASLILVLLAIGFVTSLAVIGTQPRSVRIGSQLSLFAVAYKDPKPYKIGDTFSYTFSFNQSSNKVLPYTSPDGLQYDSLWTIYTIRDAGNSIVLQPEPVEILTSTASGTTVPLTVTYSIPSTATSGEYMVASALYSIPQVFDRDSANWMQGAEKILDKGAVNFVVSTSKPVPSKNFIQSLLDRLTSLFAKLLSWQTIVR